jgi:hypothetical protein
LVSFRRLVRAFVVAGAVGALFWACSVDLAPLDARSGGTGGKASGGKAGTDASSGGLGAYGGGGSGAAAGSGGGSAGSGGIAGGGGVAGGGGGNSPLCDSFCQKVVATGCPGDTLGDCTQSCNQDRGTFPKCLTQYDAFLQCAGGGTFSCSNGYALSSCQTEWSTFMDCTWDFTPFCAVPGVAPSGGSCYGGAGCNPVTNSCGGGQVCGYEVNNDTLNCYGTSPSANVCDPCTYDGNSGLPFCNPGTECVGKNFTLCARFCCSDADCGGVAGTCQQVGYYPIVKFCAQP